MFGATKAARTWSRKVMRKERAIGREEVREEYIGIGREQGREEGREQGIEIGREQGIEIGEQRGWGQAIDELRARANGNPEIHRLLDEMDTESDAE